MKLDQPTQNESSNIDYLYRIVDKYIYFVLINEKVKSEITLNGKKIEIP